MENMQNRKDYIHQKYARNGKIKTFLKSKRIDILRHLVDEPTTILDIYEKIISLSDIKISFDYFRKVLKSEWLKEFLYATNKYIFFYYAEDIEEAFLTYQNVFSVYNVLVAKGKLKKRGRSSNGAVLEYSLFEDMVKKFEDCFDYEISELKFDKAKKEVDRSSIIVESRSSNSLDIDIPKQNKKINKNKITKDVGVNDFKDVDISNRDEAQLLNKEPMFYVESIINNGGWHCWNKDNVAYANELYLFGDDVSDLREERFFALSLRVSKNIEIKDKLFKQGAFIERDLFLFFSEVESENGFFRLIDGVLVKLHKLNFDSNTMDMAKRRGLLNVKVMRKIYLD